MRAKKNSSARLMVDLMQTMGINGKCIKNLYLRGKRNKTVDVDKKGKHLIDKFLPP